MQNISVKANIVFFVERRNTVRVLVLLRGSTGCGKSTWVKENGLERYTLSPDTIGEMCQSPELQTDGTLVRVGMVLHRKFYSEF